MNRFLTGSGALTLGGVGRGIGQGPAALEASLKKSHHMGKDMVAAIKEKRAYPEQAAAHKVWKNRFALNIQRNKRGLEI
jgi:hypothetical protein